jgi:hypothetical protein
MATWRVNAPLPGSYLQGRGLIKTGDEFQTPDDPNDPFFERAREMWIPLDAAADALVEKAKADAEEMMKENAAAVARRKQAEEDARNGLVGRRFEVKPNQIDQHFGRNADRRSAPPPPTPDEEARNRAWTEERARQLDADQSPEEKEKRQQRAVRFERDRTARASGAPPPSGTIGDSDVQPRAPKGYEPPPGAGANTGPLPATGSTPEQLAAEKARQQQQAQKK